MYMPLFSLPLKFSDFSLRIPKFPLTHCVPAGAPTVTLRTTRDEIRLQLLPIPGNVILPQTGGNMWVEKGKTVEPSNTAHHWDQVKLNESHKANLRPF